MKNQRIKFLTTPIILILILIIGLILFANEKPFDDINLEHTEVYIHNEYMNEIQTNEQTFLIEDPVLSDTLCNLAAQMKSQPHVNDSSTDLLLGVNQKAYFILKEKDIQYTIFFTEDYGLSDEELDTMNIPQIEINKAILNDQGYWSIESYWDCTLEDSLYKHLHDLVITYQHKGEKQ